MLVHGQVYRRGGRGARSARRMPLESRRSAYVGRPRRLATPRRWIRPSDAPVRVLSGRWGPRRVRVSEVWSTLRAEAVYDQFVREGHDFGPGWRARLEVHIPIRDSDGVSSWYVEVEVRANPIWRRGGSFISVPDATVARHGCTCQCPARSPAAVSPGGSATIRNVGTTRAPGGIASPGT